MLGGGSCEARGLWEKKAGVGGLFVCVCVWDAQPVPLAHGEMEKHSEGGGTEWE